MSGDRAKRGVSSLLLSLSVVAVAVALLYLVVWRPAPEEIRTVDPTYQLQAARDQASYEVLAPTGLSSDWKTTSARFEAAGPDSTTWFLGYVTPQRQYVALAQTDGDPAGFVAEQTLQGVPDGEQTIDGVVWQRYVADDQRSLVRTTAGATTVVTGTVGYEQLADFVQRLSG